eukprot:3612956-Rhodomonas_salina.1
MNVCAFADLAAWHHTHTHRLSSRPLCPGTASGALKRRAPARSLLSSRSPCRIRCSARWNPQTAPAPARPDPRAAAAISRSTSSSPRRPASRRPSQGRRSARSAGSPCSCRSCRAASQRVSPPRMRGRRRGRKRRMLRERGERESKRERERERRRERTRERERERERASAQARPRGSSSREEEEQQQRGRTPALAHERDRGPRLDTERVAFRNRLVGPAGVREVHVLKVDAPVTGRGTQSDLSP